VVDSFVVDLGRSIMLSKLSASVAECYEHAEECARSANIAGSPQLRDDFLYLERSWIKLAQSIAASERFAVFVAAEKDTKSAAATERAPA
jgi:hypothetical protein